MLDDILARARRYGNRVFGPRCRICAGGLNRKTRKQTLCKKPECKVEADRLYAEAAARRLAARRESGILSAETSFCCKYCGLPSQKTGDNQVICPADGCQKRKMRDYTAAYRRRKNWRWAPDQLSALIPLPSECSSKNCSKRRRIVQILLQLPWSLR